MTYTPCACLYSQGGKEDSYQGLPQAGRLKMTIGGRPVGGRPVCELDIRASNLTIFHAIEGQPLDFDRNPDPYQNAELRNTPRKVVKQFITAAFGWGALLDWWPQDTPDEYRAYPVTQMRNAVARAYPLLVKLRRDDAEPPLWARLMFLESQAVLRTMLALKDAGIPSLSVHDSLLVPRDCTQQAKDALSSSYAAMTGDTLHH